MKATVVCIASILVLGGCRKIEQSGIHFKFRPDANQLSSQCSLGQQVRALRASNPANDANAAFERGDYRLVAIEGVALNVPGISPRSDLLNSLALKIIRGTGDNMDASGPEINSLALDYATKYNYTMLSRLTFHNVK